MTSLVSEVLCPVDNLLSVKVTTLCIVFLVVPCTGFGGHIGPYKVWSPQIDIYEGWQPKVDSTNSYEGWHPRIEHGNSYYGWQRRMGRSDDSYDEDSYEDEADSFWDDYSTESEGSGESISSSEDSNELQTASIEDSSIEIEEDKEYFSDESENDLWDEYSDESEKDSAEVNSYEAFSSDDSNEEGEDFWHSTSDEEKEDFDSSQESERLQEAVDETYTLVQNDNAHYNYYSKNTDLVTRIGRIVD